MDRKTVGANICLILAALFWGSTFVAQSIGAGILSAFAFQGIRCLLGSAALLPVILFLDKKGLGGSWRSRSLWLGGGLCGFILFAATNLQQFGLSLGTSAGKSGFLTALYIVLVPLFGIFRRQRPGLRLWCSVVLAVVGLYLLCIQESFTFLPGDVMTLLCAVCFAMHILTVDRFTPHVDPVRLSCVQFILCGSISLLFMAISDVPTWEAVWDCRYPILYAALISCAAAYTLQIVAQKHTAPGVASLLMSLEAVFACLSGWLVLGERMTLREGFGCLIMLCAVILAQLPSRKNNPEKAVHTTSRNENGGSL